MANPETSALKRQAILDLEVIGWKPRDIQTIMDISEAHYYYLRKRRKQARKRTISDDMLRFIDTMVQSNYTLSTIASVTGLPVRAIKQYLDDKEIS